MLTLLKKEFWSFFSSITGYVVISVFLLANSLFLWVFPGNLNIMEAGYASLDSLFTIAPWVFLFLVPALTMRMFSEEKKTGTIELLLTRPLTEMEIVLSKFFASVLLVLFALIPSLIWYLSVYYLASPVGNMDTGATWGSFIGLFFLACIYAAAGLFASAITENQIIAFLLGLIISFFLYTGFESIASLPFLSNVENFIIYLGINEHYQSISRGVIDTRDIFYFSGLAALFLFSTQLYLQSRKW